LEHIDQFLRELGINEWFVALNVDDDFNACEIFSDLGDAVCAARVLGRGGRESKGATAAASAAPAAAAGPAAAGASTAGSTTLIAGTIVVSTTAVTANSIILITAQSGTVTGNLKISARTAGTSFTILSTVLTDTPLVGWLIIN
jgi:hypothetical protein